MHSKENRTIPYQSSEDPFDENTRFPFQTLKQIQCVWAPKREDLLDVLAENETPQHYLPYSSLFPLRSKGQQESSLYVSSLGLESSSPILYQQVQTIARIHPKSSTCNCRESHCANNYCQCLKFGNVCSKDTCGCQGCFNLTESSIHSRNREKKKSLRSVCNCKRNQCESRYCECYDSGKGCRAECQCAGCLNRYGRHVPNSGSERRLRDRNA